MTLSFKPQFTITTQIKKSLEQIESAKKRFATIKVLKPAVKWAKNCQIRYFDLLEESKPFQQDLRGYLQALDQVYEWGLAQEAITEHLIKSVHGRMMNKSRASPYRKGQCGVFDSEMKQVLYLPPNAREVPALMRSLVSWIEQSSHLPVPIVAAVAHFGINSIHPYYDGNGRCSRLLTLLILIEGGYSLDGLLCLEEYYAHDLEAYYQALAIDESISHYDSRAKMAITPWLEYFCKGMASSCRKVLSHLSSSSTG